MLIYIYLSNKIIYLVNIVIVDLSGEGLIESELFLFWKNNSMPDYEQIQLQVDGFGGENAYTAFIPISPIETNIQYYIQASDNTGRTEKLPMAGYFDFFTVSGISYPEGDVNLDNLVNIVDIITIVNHILGQVELDGLALSFADMNNDAIINILDIIAIVNVILGN